MSISYLTQNEAERLLSMLKKSIIDSVDFPQRGSKEEFDVVGDSKSDVFRISVYRSNIRHNKYSVGARIKKNGVVLLELHIGETLVHTNPDGAKIKGNHWHIYTEKYDRAYAEPAADIEDADFVGNTILFLMRFNVIDRPDIRFQTEI